MPESRSPSDSPDPDRTVVDPTVMAERRARRAELAEEGLNDRVRAAEELADKLRHRSDELERELAAAARERDDLLGRLSSRERALVTVQQQEESERRRRHEVEVEGDADRRRLEQEVSDLRVRVGAAEAWAAELSAELTRTRNELDASRRAIEDEREARLQLERGTEDHAARSQALQARREDMAAEVAALREQAGGLAERLAEEERERSEAQAVLLSERERAEAQITLLEHELDRRAEIHDAVLAQLRGLGGEVARVRDGVAGDAERRAQTERTLSEVADTARRLRGELEQLQRDRDAIGAELGAARTALAAREEALAQTRAEVGAVRADLEAVLTDTNRQADALTAAQHALAGTQAALAESQHALAGSHEALAERDQALTDARAGSDALLAEVQSHRAERDILSEAVADGVAERDAALAAQHQGFQAQVAGFEHTVVDLRGRLTAAAEQFDRRLGEELAARRAAEHELATQAEAFAAERERLVAGEAQLEASRAEVEASRDRLVAELAEARQTVVVERERADAGAALAEHVRSDRDRLAAELARRDALDEHVRGTLLGLRGELDDLRLQSDAREAREAAVERLVADLVDTARELREGFDRELQEVRGRFEARGLADLEAADARLAAMRLHLESSVDQLRDDLEVEQAARQAAETSLGQERHRVEAAGLAAVDAAVARDDLARELQARLAAEEDARTALAAAEEELTLLRRTSAPSQEDALAVVESLTRAARRLREESELVVEEAPAEPEALAPEPGPEVARVPGPAPAPAPVVVVPAAPAPPAAGAPRTDAVPVRPRVVALEDRVPNGWMMPALVLLAEEEPDVAAAALITMLPALGLVATRELRCDVTLRGRGTWRVMLTPGVPATVATLTRSSGDPDVTLVGDVAALAPLAAGGMQRRFPGVDLIGRRRRLRRLLKDRRAPIGLTDLRRAEVTPSAGVLLALLTRGVAPEWVAGPDVVDFVVAGPFGGTWRVTTTPGERPRLTVPGEDAPAAEATVHVADVAILSLLAVTPLPPGERLLIAGDVDAANAVTGLFGRAQGIAAVTA